MATINHLLQRGIQAHTKGDLAAALSEYQKILEKDPTHVDALHLSGLVEYQSGHLEQAEFLIRAAIALNTKAAPFYSNLGSVLVARGQAEEALAVYEQAVALAPDFIDGWNNLGNLASKMGDHSRAAQCFTRLVELSDGRDGQAMGFLSLAQAALCDWSGLAETKRKILSQDKGWLRPIPPFTILMHDFTPIQQRAIAEFASFSHHQEVEQTGLKPYTHPAPGPRPPKLRIAFIGDDFQDHAVGYLFVGLIEAIDHTRFETLIINTGDPKNQSAIRTRIRASADHMLEVAHQSWPMMAQTVQAAHPHVLIDLKGHTGTARPHLFHLHPAPIQVAWLGYPGTFGGSAMDYILADSFIIPEGPTDGYSETPVRLPHAYQPNDPKRPYGKISKVEAGLPEDAFVFAALSNSFKIGQAVFASWMEILKNCPGSVLWLLDNHPTTTDNLKAAALQARIDPDRLIFAPRVNQDRHMARLSAADLALDTFPYGGHTTTSDFLWAGVPVIALVGQTFASRVAGSLLTQTGLPQLVTESTVDYEQKAIEFFDNREGLAALKSHLETNRSTLPLFDANTFARDFETAMDDLWSGKYR